MPPMSQRKHTGYLGTMEGDDSTLPLIKDTVHTRQSAFVRYYDRWVWSNGSLLVMLSSVFFACVAMMVKLLNGRVPATQVLLIRATAIGTLLPIKMKCVGGGMSLGSKENLHLLILSGCIVAIHLMGAWLSVVSLPIADAMAIIFANTIITATIGLIARMETWSKWTPVGVIISVVGVVLITRPPMLFGGAAVVWGSQRLTGMLWAALASVMLSLLLIVLRKIGKQEPVDVVLLWQQVIVAICAFISLCLGMPFTPVFTAAPHDILMICGVVIQGYIAWVLLNRGSQLSSPTLVAVLTSIELAYSLLADIFVFGEAFHLITLAGLLSLMVASVIVAATVNPVVG